MSSTSDSAGPAPSPEPADPPEGLTTRTPAAEVQGPAADDQDAAEFSSVSSIDLVRRAQAGEYQALNDLVGRYYARVLRIVRLRLGRSLRGFLESDDILQETFIAAIHGFDRFEMRTESSLLHWLAHIAENQIRAAVDYHGAKKRDRRRETSLRFARDAMESGEIVVEPQSPGPLPLDGLVREEDAEAVEGCIAELCDESRELILLRHYVGGSWEQVREWTGGTSVDAVRMRHARALTELSRLVRRRVVE
ncbi:MAG: sigma-70 family RNA polymerase sigma factor [Planctomycetes bacterium]|nr:sigma-70 family RNA polymerase sigma factor [Planctomycetota bacterium]